MGPSSALGHHDTAAGRPLGVTQRGSGFATGSQKCRAQAVIRFLATRVDLKQAAALAEVERREASWGPRAEPFSAGEPWPAPGRVLS
jgi:hypothetical protein